MPVSNTDIEAAKSIAKELYPGVNFKTAVIKRIDIQTEQIETLYSVKSDGGVVVTEHKAEIQHYGRYALAYMPEFHTLYIGFSEELL